MYNDKVFPYSSLIIDAEWSDFLRTTWRCFSCNEPRSTLCSKLQQIWKTEQNPNYSLPMLAVRTALDMYLSIMNFPEGSEVIMSGINIPDMVQIVRHHKLKVVSLDIRIDDVSPKVELFEALISSKTKLVIVAHIYGKWCDLNELLDLTEKYGIPLIEDCAEGFHGFSYIGNPRSELALFSFGTIKYSTAFGGAIAKIKSRALFEKMHSVHESYPVQSQTEYLKKVLKYGIVRLLMNVRFVTGTGFSLARAAKFDVQRMVVGMVRGFPVDLLRRMRHQPCSALLATLLHRHTTYPSTEHLLATVKGEYMSARLPEAVFPVGVKATINNYWLFPVIVERPEELVRHLYELGVHAYRGATQLNLVETDIAPDQQKVGSVGNTVTPQQGSVTPQQKFVTTSVTPHQGTVTTTVTPQQGSVTTHQGSVTPHQESVTTTVTPHQGTVAPHQGSVTQHQGSLTNTVTPHQESMTKEIRNTAECSDLTDESHHPNTRSATSKTTSSGDNNRTSHSSDLNALTLYYQRFPHEAKYLMDHVVYLPVHKLVPFSALDHLAECLAIAVERSLNGSHPDVKQSNKFRFRPKLKSNL